MRQIEVCDIAGAVEALCIESNYHICGDIKSALLRAKESESSALAGGVLGQLLENAEIAGEGLLPLCQDTGMAVVFAEVGQDVHITGGSLSDAINEGVRNGYKNGYLRGSVVADAVRRTNTKDNTPAVIHYSVVPGDRLRITLMPKGFGSENMSRLAMLTPSQGLAGIKGFILETVKTAGPNPCPPIIVGVGIGGTMEKSAILAKESLLRPVGTSNPDGFWDEVERELIHEINALDIGPAGFGGSTTALAVHIKTYPTHIAGMPVAVNIGCHSTRHAEAVI